MKMKHLRAKETECLQNEFHNKLFKSNFLIATGNNFLAKGYHFF